MLLGGKVENVSSTIGLIKKDHTKCLVSRLLALGEIGWFQKTTID